jgi:hypothetical protein
MTNIAPAPTVDLRDLSHSHLDNAPTPEFVVAGDEEGQQRADEVGDEGEGGSGGEATEEKKSNKAAAPVQDIVSEQLAEDERRLQMQVAAGGKAAPVGKGRGGMLQQAFEAFLRHHQGNNRIDAGQLQSVLQEAGLEMDTVRGWPLY